MPGPDDDRERFRAQLVMTTEVAAPERHPAMSGRGGVHHVAALPLALGAIVLTGAMVRLWGLGAKSLWFDEAYSLFIARQPLGEMLRLLAGYDNHPPLYYALVHLWIRLVGDGEVAVRLPSALASLAAIVPTFLLARRVAGERAALLAAAIFAVAPFQLAAGQEARMYPFLTLFGTATSYALWCALSDGARRSWMGYAVFMVLALSTHYLAFLLLVAHGFYVATFERGRLPAWMRWTALVLLAGFLLLPLVWPQMATVRALPAFQKPLAWRGLADLMGLMSFGGGVFGAGTYYQRGTLSLPAQLGVLLPFLAVFLVGFAAMGARPRAFVTAGWLVPVTILALIGSRGDVFQERYFSPVHPLFVITLGAGVAALTSAARGFRRVAAWGGVLVLGGLVAASLVGFYRREPLYAWRASAQYVQAQAGADDFILYLPVYVGIPFDYYFPGHQERTDLDPRQVLTAHQAATGRLRLRTSVAPERMAAIAGAHRRMWIISSLGLGPQMRARIGEALAPYFRLVDERTFGLVSASLWESRLTGRQRP